ncbi:MAG: AraC family ligand binding domain-containing protein [Bacteroidales bacterium]|nr:AraC family ligand binding domain-containing protein [Bacteroidales bacterium]
MKLLDAPNNQCFLFSSVGEAGGDSVLCLGKQVVRPSDPYPLSGFPKSVLFEENGGRCLNDYQLVFIAEGEGVYQDRGVKYPLDAGSMFLLRPGVWHSYAPSKQSGWTEYYAGFQGTAFTRLALQGFPFVGGGY